MIVTKFSQDYFIMYSSHPSLPNILSPICWFLRSPKTSFIVCYTYRTIHNILSVKTHAEEHFSIVVVSCFFFLFSFFFLLYSSTFTLKYRKVSQLFSHDTINSHCTENQIPRNSIYCIFYLFSERSIRDPDKEIYQQFTNFDEYLFTHRECNTRYPGLEHQLCNKYILQAMTFYGLLGCTGV